MKKATPFDKEIIRELADLLGETGLSEIEIEHNGQRIRVARGVSTGHFVSTPSPTPPAGHSAPALGTAAPAATLPASEQAGAVNSPMVGTAYLAPEPGTTPFVTVGTTVAAGQTVLIIEAMKTMNHIAAPRAGVVTAVFVEDGQPVEFGEALLSIE